MQRRTFPSILLYSFGLALALSLVFNGFLLYKQSHQQGLYEYELSSSAHPVEQIVWQQQLSDCQRTNRQQDSLIRRLEQVPPGQPIAVQQPSP
ncbi:hypothetical protein [Spirosoma pomorum]